MTEDFKPGDRVSWNTPQGETIGKVVEKITEERRVKGGKDKGTRVTGSEEDPRYLVESEKSGKQAAHPAAALTRQK